MRTKLSLPQLHHCHFTVGSPFSGEWQCSENSCKCFLEDNQTNKTWQCFVQIKIIYATSKGVIGPWTRVDPYALLKTTSCRGWRPYGTDDAAPCTFTSKWEYVQYVCLSSLLWNGDVPGAPVWTCWTGNWPQNMYPEWIKKIISLTNPVLLDFQLCFPLRFFGSIPFDEFQSVTIHDAQAGLGWICFCCTVTVNEDRKDRIIIERKLQRLALRYWDRNSV